MTEPIYENYVNVEMAEAGHTPETPEEQQRSLPRDTVRALGTCVKALVFTGAANLAVEGAEMMLDTTFSPNVRSSIVTAYVVGAMFSSKSRNS